MISRIQAFQEEVIGWLGGGALLVGFLEIGLGAMDRRGWRRWRMKIRGRV